MWSGSSLKDGTQNSGSMLFSASFNPAETLIVAGGSAKNEARVFVNGTYKHVGLLEFEKPVYSCEFSPDGNFLGVGGASSQLHVFNVASYK